MDISGMLAANFWYIFLAVFLAGTALLFRTKHQRSYIIFLMRTQHGIRMLDRIGAVSPRGWKFLGDLAVIISFGGLGAAYVSRYRKPAPFLLLLGALALLMLIPVVGGAVAAGLFILLLFGIASIRRASLEKAGSFAMGSLIMFAIVFSFAGTVSPGPASYGVAAITGVFGLPGLLVSALATQATAIVLQESSLPGVSPLLPGLSAEGQLGFIFPGFDIFIPLWSGLLALLILLVSHEFSHGILARVQGIPVKNMGLLTFGIIPIGAFVEPDEKSLVKKHSEEKMRVYAMGSFANMLIAAIATLLVLAVSLQASGMIEPGGIEIVSVQEGFPAEVLEPGSVITAINGVAVAALDDYLNESLKLSPGDTITLEISNGTVSLVSVANPQDSAKAYLGFNLRTKAILNRQHAGQEQLLAFLLSAASALQIIFFLNFNIAIVNLLPITPFDGSKMFDELLKSFHLTAAKRKRIINWVVALILILLIVNALPLGGVFMGYLGA